MTHGYRLNNEMHLLLLGAAGSIVYGLALAVSLWVLGVKLPSRAKRPLPPLAARSRIA